MMTKVETFVWFIALTALGLSFWIIGICLFRHGYDVGVAEGRNNCGVYNVR